MVCFLRKWPALAVFIILLAFCSLLHPYKRTGPSIRSDGVGYHLWTRAILNLDLNFCDFQTRYPGTVEIRGAISDPNLKTKKCQNKYPPGLALLRLPFMAPLVKFAPYEPLISRGEQNMNQFLGMIALILILLIIAKVLMSFSVYSSLIQSTLIFGVFGTGLFHYAVFDSCFTHIYSALGVSILGSLFCSEYRKVNFEKTEDRNKLISSTTILFLILIRNTNVFLVAFYFFCLIYLKSKKSKNINIFELLLSNLFAMSAALALQLAYNYYCTGRVTMSSYGNEGFLWARPMVLSVLFSYDRGVFTYFPILFMILSFGVMTQTVRLPSLAFAGVILFNALLYGFWWTWTLGDGFGHRGFIELAPVFIFILGILMSELSTRYSRILQLLSAICAWASLQLMWGYWQGTYPFSKANGHEYWGHLLTMIHGDFAVFSAVGLVAVLMYGVSSQDCRKKVFY